MRSFDKTILVTGGAGFIGSAFVFGLLEASGFEVVNLDALTYAGNVETLAPIFDNPKHTFVKGDIGDRTLVSCILGKHRPGAVINFAAETHVDRSIDDPGPFMQTNVVATQELLAAVLDYWRTLRGPASDGFRFLHLSTDEVYGSLGEMGYFTEETPYAPNSPYAASKAASSHLVRAYHSTYGLPVITVTCSNNYGPRQFPEKLIPLTIHNALSGKPIPVYGDGEHVRDWLYVDDHCRALLEVLKAGRVGETYNVGGHNEKTNLEVVHAVCGLLDRMVPESPSAPHASLITFVEDRPGHDRRYAMDTGKIRHELGWTPQETLESGLVKTVRWHLRNQSWYQCMLSGAYRGERLGLAEGQGGGGW
jgi:dTDP-glucose 4,6-dehydratase